MARPTTISDEKILEAARAVFLEHGIAATTAEVAKRAGTSEGSLFKRWPTKAELFKAAMQIDFDTLDFLRTLVAAEDGDDPRLTLFQFGMEAVGFFRRLMPLVMLQFGTGKKLGIPDQLIGPNAPPLRALKTLAAYLERQIRAVTCASTSRKRGTDAPRQHPKLRVLRDPVARAAEDAAPGRGVPARSHQGPVDRRAACTPKGVLESCSVLRF